MAQSCGESVGCSSYRRSRGIGRRGMLRAGVLAGLGLSLPEYLRMQAASAMDRKPARARSVLLVWGSGGVSHHDTFDPKPQAPAEVRGEFGVLPTSVSGLQFSDRVPLLAKQAHRFALLRCVHHREADHGVATYYMLRGYSQPSPAFDRPENQRNTHPNIGSLVAREIQPDNHLPAYICVPGLSYVEQVNYFTAGWMGARYAPFVLKADPNDAGFAVRDMSPPPGVTPERAGRRFRLLDRVDAGFRRLEHSQDVSGMDCYYQGAYQLLSSSSARRAFCIEEEPAAMRDAYGRTRLGQSCLLARRLIEAGVPFVTVDDDGWDHHGQIFPGLKARLPDLDRSLSTLIADLADRGLLEQTLLLFLTDFGRTPQINKSAGRDHWPGVFSVFFAGAGIAGGQVIGASDATGAEPVERAITPKEIAATVYHFLGIDWTKEYLARDGRPFRYLDEGAPIPEFL